MPQESISELFTVADHIRWAASRFGNADLHYGHGTDNALDEARWLVLGALHLPFALPDAYLHAQLTVEERERITGFVKQRVDARLPAAYLLGEAWFCGQPYYVDDRVLIPRSPIAELIGQGFVPHTEPEQLERVLDLCCGSGCIGIATALGLPWTRVDLADISPGALDVALSNVERHRLRGRCRVIQSDLFAGLAGERYDLILSNPPYVPREEMLELPDEYRREPSLGLVAGDDGLSLVLPMLQQAPNHLTENGLLICEVGTAAQTLAEAFPEIEFNWLEFEQGGEGVFALTAAQLEAAAPMLADVML